MSVPRYRVTLTAEERQELETRTRTAKTNAKQFRCARVLLLCDAGPQGPAWTVADTAEAMGVTSRTIEHLKKRFVEEGLSAALERKPLEKPPRGVTFDGAFEARLIALACSQAPKGHSRWTLHLLAEQLVELKIVDSISHETVRKTLKKIDSSRGNRNGSASQRKIGPASSRTWRKSSTSTTRRATPPTR